MRSLRSVNFFPQNIKFKHNRKPRKSTFDLLAGIGIRSPKRGFPLIEFLAAKQVPDLCGFNGLLKKVDIANLAPQIRVVNVSPNENFGEMVKKMTPNLSVGVHS